MEGGWQDVYKCRLLLASLRNERINSITARGMPGEGNTGVGKAARVPLKTSRALGALPHGDAGSPVGTQTRGSM